MLDYYKIYVKIYMKRKIGSGEYMFFNYKYFNYTGSRNLVFTSDVIIEAPSAFLSNECRRITAKTGDSEWHNLP